MTEKYTVTAASARFHQGVLELTKEQAASRLHNLKAKGKGCYEIVNPVEFKRGEVIGYDGALPKALGDLMETEAKQLTKKEKAKQEAEAKAKAEAAKKLAEEAEARTKAAWEGSEELQKTFPAFADYLASLLADEGGEQ